MLDIARRVFRGSGWWEPEAWCSGCFLEMVGERRVGPAVENCGDGSVMDVGRTVSGVVTTGGDVIFGGETLSSSSD